MYPTTTPQSQKPATELCADWWAVAKAFDSFLTSPMFSYDSEGELSGKSWIFRGHKSASYTLQPSIERAAETKSLSWAALELKVIEEFRPQARLHMDPFIVPREHEKLSWLALMQHYGVPTRLLDFTFSPYVALYFALRNRTEEKERSQPSVAVWAIDTRALMSAAKKKSAVVDREEEDRRAKEDERYPDRRPKIASFLPENAYTESDVLRDDTEHTERLISRALAPSGIRRDRFSASGFVALASPPTQNRRLSSQQGVFLFNGAEELLFQDSLFKMMNGHREKWCRLFEIPSEILPDIERRLFQANIHDSSLFPDIEGLAGFIRQKIRLQWVPDDCPVDEDA